MRTGGLGRLGRWVGLAAVAAAAGCAPVCPADGGACIELSVEGAGRFQDVQVQWRFASARQPIGALVQGGLPGTVELPSTLRLTPPPRVPLEEVTTLGVSAVSAAAPDTRLAGSAEVAPIETQQRAVTVPLVLRLREVFLPLTTMPLATAVADLNQDGVPDLILAMGSHVDPGGKRTEVNTVELRYQAAGGGFPEGKRLAVPSGPRFASLDVADLDGQGGPDIALGTYADQILLWKGDGSLLYGAGPAAVLGVPPASPIRLQSAQLDGKGPLELAVVTWENQGRLGLWSLQAGTYQRVGPTPGFSVGFNPQRIAAGDFDGDGIADLALSNGGETARGLTIVLNNGLWGTKKVTTLTDLGADPGALQAADFNGDGRLDLAVASLWDQTLSIWLGAGAGTFAKRSVSYLGTAFFSNIELAVADFDLDGRPDLALVNNSSTMLSVLRGRGDGTLHPPIGFGLADPLGSIVAADLDGNGRVDLITTTRDLAGVRLFMNEPL